MSKRRYTNMQALLPVIEQMIEAGLSHRQIEEELGLEGDPEKVGQPWAADT